MRDDSGTDLISLDVFDVPNIHPFKAPSHCHVATWRCSMFSLCNLCTSLFLAMPACCQANGNVTIFPTLMRPAAIFFTFRFSSRRHSPTPLTATLRKPTVVAYSPWGSVSERMFYRGALRQNSSSGPETSGHSERAAKPFLRENEARCQCCQHLRGMNISQDQGSRSPFVDALLTALMGIGIGELQF